MATGSSHATLPSRELGVKDLSGLYEALYPVRAKYRGFGLQIEVDLDEIKNIESNNNKDSGNCLLEILSSRLKRKPALTCNDIDKALRSRTVDEHTLADDFQSNFECKSVPDPQKKQIEIKKESSKKSRAAKSTESESSLKMSKTESERMKRNVENKERTQYYVESEDESKSDQSENIQKTVKSAEIEREVHERDEPKSKRAKKRARKKERAVKSQCSSEQPVSESTIQLKISKKETERSERMENVESDDESKSDESENIKSAEVERQVHERDDPKSKRAKKRARKGEKIRCAGEKSEPDEYKEDERKQMKGKQKQEIQFLEMAASPQSGAASDQKRKRSVKESEKIAPEIISTDSENESSDACKEKEILFSKNEKTGRVRECGSYSEVKHQPQSAKIREVKNEARKKGKIPEKEGSTKKQHSVLHRKTAVAVELDEDTSEQPSHKSKKKLEAEETESKESFLESTSDESETESPKHKEKVKPKSSTDTEEMYHDSDEEIEKVRAKDKKKMPQKSKVATAKSSPRLVEEEQCKQNKGKRSVDMKEQERESELPAKGSRGKLHEPHSQVKEREGVKETDSGMKAKRLVAHSSEQTLHESETDCENEESDSGNDSSEDGEDSEGKSSDEEEKTETNEESSTALSEEEVKKKKKTEKSVSCEKEKAKKEGGRKLMEKRVSKAAVELSRYDPPQGGRRFDETHMRKVKGKRESKAASLKYDSPGDDGQSDPGHSSRDREEHDIQQRRRKKKQQRRESNMSPTAIGSSSPSTSQEEKKKQPVSKKQGHKKKHMRKMKEKRERMKRGKEKAGCSSGTDDSSPECDMTKNQYESDMKELVNILERFHCKGEMKELVDIFERFFGKLCRAVFDPVDIAVELQMNGLISKAMMRDMMLSPESQQSKIIHFFDALDEKIKSCPDHLFMIIEVMLKNEALQEIARDIMSELGTQCLVCALHFVLDSKTLFPAGRVCPVKTAAKFPSQVPPSDTAVPSTADTLSPTAKGMLSD